MKVKNMTNQNQIDSSYQKTVNNAYSKVIDILNDLIAMPDNIDGDLKVTAIVSVFTLPLATTLHGLSQLDPDGIEAIKNNLLEGMRLSFERHVERIANGGGKNETQKVTH